MGEDASALMLKELRRMARFPCNGSRPTHMPIPSCESREVWCIGAVPCFPCWAARVVRKVEEVTP